MFDRLLGLVGVIRGLRHKPVAAASPTVVPTVVPTALQRASSEALQARRGALFGSGADLTGMPEPGSLGVAFSGGGIRSATISLGAAQAFAHHKRLLDFDYLSTVSGGGYFGSFLASLYYPSSARGASHNTNLIATDDDLRRHREFADRAFTSDARDHEIAGPDGVKVRNPIWWLREHGRYLAPNGATDYGMAVAYLARNWLAMIYVFALAIAAIYLLQTAVTVLAINAFPDLIGKGMMRLVRGHIDQSCTSLEFSIGDTGPAIVSPVLALAPLALLVSVASGVAYWLTAWLPVISGSDRQNKPKPVFFAGLLASGLCVGGAAWALGHWPTCSPSPLVPLDLYPTLFASWTARLGLVIAALAVGVAFLIGLLSSGADGGAFTADARRRLTMLSNMANQFLVIVLVLGGVDTAALYLADPIAAFMGTNPKKAAAGIAVAPAAAWLINKVVTMLSGRSDALKWVSKHLAIVALVVGLALFGLLALFVDIFVQLIVWSDGAWNMPLSLPFFLTVAAVATFLALLTGLSTGFINLSSLHNLYAARLTRAFLGASNISRLGAAVKEYRSVTESDPADDMPIAAYSKLRTCAPLHLINVTLNETKNRARSQLVERDRKGVPIVFAPEGVLLDAACTKDEADHWFSWASLDEASVESLSVGQLCAISGAAASTGMGARTSLGSALTLSFANVRLGYWWKVQDLIRGKIRLSEISRTMFVKVFRPLHTFFYLWYEMTSRYSRDYDLVYLSDGGHFENSGAYELLRREVRTILVYDNGADPEYAFEDLENLIRKARIDLGISVNVASSEAVTEMLGAKTDIFLNSDDDDWRAAAALREGPAVGLVLLGYVSSPRGPVCRHRIIWLKPRLISALPQDVRSYGLANSTFPNETTADQFFDEAQWESYRAVGYSLTESLMTGTLHGSDVLRHVSV